MLKLPENDALLYSLRSQSVAQCLKWAATGKESNLSSRKLYIA